MVQILPRLTDARLEHGTKIIQTKGKDLSDRAKIWFRCVFNIVKTRFALFLTDATFHFIDFVTKTNFSYTIRYAKINASGFDGGLILAK